MSGFPIGVMRAIAVLFVTAGVVACTEDEAPVASPDAGAPTGASPEVVACGRGEACPTGQHCDPFKGCVGCLFDGDCAASEICMARECVAPASCTKDADCTTSAGPSVCDLSNGHCVECLTDATCGQRQHCVDRKCEAYEACVNSFDCKDGRVCNRQRGECVQCATPGDCPQGEVCANDHCVRTCDGDNDCRELNQLCDLAAGHCAECVVNVDCPEVYHCTRGECVLDVCRPGYARCDATGKSLVQCNSDGTEIVASICQYGTACSSSSTSPSCIPWTCTPSTTDCDSTKTKIQVCSADGLSIASATDCASGERCVAGKCVTQVCTPGTFACKDGQIGTCNADGTSVGDLAPCATGNYCDPKTNACVPGVCAPGSLSCATTTSVQTCLADGSGYDAPVDCATSEACEAGKCLPVVCAPGATLCGAGSIQLCNASGTASTFQSYCTFGQVCDDSSGTALCKSVSCTAGGLYCDGDVANTCNAQGTGPEPGSSKDCSKTQQACLQGACKDRVCSGSSFCQGSDLYSCLDNGTRTSLQRTCASGYYCFSSGTSATCNLQICTPGANSCNGNVVAKCNADGSGFETGGTDCAATNKACLNATCLPVICTANQRFCQSGSVYTCGAQGVSSTLYQTCTASQYCNATSTSASCASDICTAGNPICRNDFATTCKSDGSGPEATGGTDCAATGKACDSGTCKAIVCPKGELYCNAGDVYGCNATGTASSLYTTCTSDPSKYCKDSGTTATCENDICTANGPACNGETATTCNADGSGYAAGGTNCAATSKVCNEAAVCAATALDTIGSSAYSYSSSSSAFVGDLITTRIGRTLTKIEAYLILSGTSVFTWVVYEAPASGGTYTKIFESTTSGSGTGFQSSGTISVTLKPSMSYFVGVWVNSSFSYGSNGSTAVQNTSFAQAKSGVVQSSTTVPTTTTFYSSFYGLANVRLTTAP